VTFSASEVYSDDESASADDRGTLVFENPDGSLHHALPTGVTYKKPSSITPPLDPRGRGLGLNDWVIWDPEILAHIERLYKRHERVFVFLLMIQLVLENGFLVMLMRHMDATKTEIHRAYPFFTDYGLEVAFWSLIGIGYGFGLVYYLFAVVSVWDRRAVYMKIFSDIAIVGVLAQVMFAYINRFNLILFFLRFVIFAHSRFLFAILNGTARIVISSNNPTEPILIDV
jgi:hypothetical protein